MSEGRGHSASPAIASAEVENPRMPNAMWLNHKLDLSESRKVSFRTIGTDEDFLAEGASQSHSAGSEELNVEEPPAGFSPAFWKNLDSRIQFGIKTLMSFLVAEGFMRMPGKARGAVALAVVGGIVVLSSTNKQVTETLIDLLTDSSSAIGASVAIGIDVLRANNTRHEAAVEFNQAFDIASTLLGVFIAAVQGRSAYMRYSSLARSMRADAHTMSAAAEKARPDIFYDRSQLDTFTAMMARMNQLQFVPAEHPDEQPVIHTLNDDFEEAKSESEGSFKPGARQEKAEEKQAVDGLFDEIRAEFASQKEEREIEPIEEPVDVEKLIPDTFANLFKSNKPQFLLKKKWFRILLRLAVGAAVAWSAADLMKKDSIVESFAALQTAISDGSLLDKLKDNKIMVGLTTVAGFAGAIYFRRFLKKLVLSFFTKASFMEVLLIGSISYGMTLLGWAYKSKLNISGPLEYKTSSWVDMAKSYLAPKVTVPSVEELKEDWEAAPSTSELEIGSIFSEADFAAILSVHSSVDKDVLVEDLEKLVTSSDALSFVDAQVKICKNSSGNGYKLKSMADLLSPLQRATRVKFFSFVKAQKLAYAKVTKSMKIVTAVGLAATAAYTAYSAYNWYTAPRKSRRGLEKPRKAKEAPKPKKEKTPNAWATGNLAAQLNGESEKEYKARVMREKFFKRNHMLDSRPVRNVYERIIKSHVCLNDVFDERGCLAEKCPFKHSESIKKEIEDHIDQAFDDEGKRRRRLKKRAVPVDPKKLGGDIDKSGESVETEEVVEEQIVKPNEAFAVSLTDRTRQCLTKEGNFIKNCILINKHFGLTCAHGGEDAGIIVGKENVKLTQNDFKSVDLAWFANPTQVGMSQSVPFRAATERDTRVFILSRDEKGDIKKSFGDFDPLTGLHKCNTLPGWSGSPVFSSYDHKLIAIHSGAVRSKAKNVATVFTPEIVGQLKSLALNRKA